MYTVEFTSRALRQLEKLDANIQKRIIATLERVQIRPQAYVKKLVSENAYSLRVGTYRLILEIHKSKLLILVIKVGHRKNVYKN